MTTTFLLGGARSGKSRLAQRTAEACEGPLTYIATGEARDAEMAGRIASHRADRGPRWTTLECPIDVAGAVGAVREGAALVDCLTLWLSNIMLAGRDVETDVGELVGSLEQASVPLFIVSNEVGLGIVPETALGRTFRDEAGRLNQLIAAASARVLFVAAGFALPLK